jgi:hypothetical protein
MRCKHGFYKFGCAKLSEKYDLSITCECEDPESCSEFEEYKEGSE